MNSKQIKDGQLQVWWIPQVPMSPFTVYVNSPAEGRLLVDALAAYDLFQLNNNIKPDYCNVGGLRVWRDGAWEEWEDDEGKDISDTDPRNL